MTATTRIEPRLHARRVAVLRAQGRRRLRLLLVAPAALGVAAVGWLALRSPLLDVDRITVHGTRALPGDGVRAAAGVDIGDPLVLVDGSEVERRIERVAWVREAQVHRDLPGRLRITVTERVPTVWARRDSGAIALVDGTGRVLADVAAAPALPELIGLARLPGAGSNVGPVAAAGLAHRLPPVLRDRTTGVVIAGGEATLRLDGGVEVRLGPPVRVAEKARTAAAVLEAAAGHPTAYVDVRVPATPVTG